MLEFSQSIPVRITPANELTFIKTHAIVKKQFYIHRNQGLTVFVYGVLQLDTDFFQTIHYYSSFLFRKMQCLIYGIGKESIIFNAFPQGSPMNQVRMKDDAINLRGDFVLYRVNTGCLAGSKTNDSSFFIIIRGTSVFDITTFGLFQEKRIKSVIHLDMINHIGCFGKVDNTNQGM